MTKASQEYSKLRGEALVALLRTQQDFQILKTEGWYRIPTKGRKIAGFPPQVLAFYQPLAFGLDAFQVAHFGEVAEISEVRRIDLLPNEPEHPRAQEVYYRLQLRSLERFATPIPSIRHRRLLFIPTTRQKLAQAEEVNDLFHESPLEDALWASLKRSNLRGERQWAMQVGHRKYLLDFAVFCKNGFVNIETDGDTWHTSPKKAQADNVRNNGLGALGWTVLRYSSRQIREELETYCLPNIQKAIAQYGGLGYPDVDRDVYPESTPAPRLLRETAGANAYTNETPIRLDAGVKINIEQ